MDLARLKGIDLATASGLIGKALDGQMRGLKSVGIELDSNATATEVLAAVTKTAGGQAEAFAAGPMGKQLVAQEKVGEAMEKLGAAVDKVASVLIPIAAEAFTLLVDVISAVWTAIGPVVDAIVGLLAPAFKAIAAVVRGTVVPVLATIYNTALPGIKKGLDAIVPVFRTSFQIIGTVVKAAIAVVSTALKAGGAAFKAVQTVIVGVVTTIRNVINNLVVFFGQLPGRIASATRGMWNGILGAFKSVINAIIRGWNSLSFSLPRVDTPFGVIGGFTLGTPNIPYLHSGGIVPGRRGSDVPAILQAGERVIPMNEAGSGNGGSVVINIESFIGSDRDIDRFADRVALRLRIAR
jgi:hypothetical protein